MPPATKRYLSLAEERAYMFDVPRERMSFGDRGVRSGYIAEISHHSGKKWLKVSEVINVQFYYIENKLAIFT